MKSLKKILAVLLATAMVAGMGVMSFGEGMTLGRITLKRNDTVSLENRTFTAYRILDASYATSGTNASGAQIVTTIAYTVPDNMKNWYMGYFGITGPSGTKSVDTLIIEAIQAIGDDSGKLQTFLAAALVEARKYPDRNAGNATVAADGSVATFDNLPSGYYLIEETDTKKPVSALMLDTVTGSGTTNDVQIIIKANDITPDKKIVATSGTEVIRTSGTYSPVASGSTTDSNNIGIGSTVNFQVSQNVPNYNGYEHFYFILNDTLSKGLTFNNDVRVYIDINGDGDFDDKNLETRRTARFSTSGSGVLNKEVIYTGLNEELELGKDFFVYGTENADGSHLYEIAFDDIMKYPINADIVITYSANVNNDAITGYDPNTNTAQFIYSNNPSGSSRHDEPSGPSGSPKSGVPDEIRKLLTGSGPKNLTTTYTTELKVTKKDNNSGALAGAEFTLTGSGTQVKVKFEETFVVDPENGTYWLLNNGQYTTTAPDEYDVMVPAASGATSGYVLIGSSDASATDVEKLQWVTIASGTTAGTYRPYVAGKDAGPVYVLSHNTNDQYRSTITKYRKVNSGTVDTGTVVVPVSMVAGPMSGSTNVFDFSQLGAGHYILSETKVPAGYNKAPDIEFDIVWIPPTQDPIQEDSKCGWQIANVKQGGQNLPSGTLTLTASGTFTTDVINVSGLELPSTGGIGTTIFYAGGAILVLLAGILLVSKRRFA